MTKIRSNLKCISLVIMMVLSFGILLTATQVQADTGDVMLVPLDGTVGVQMEEFVRESLTRAASEQCAVVILKLDTPGGLVEAMRGIVQSILASQVPVVVWVSPGGRAASAGAFIVQAAHVAAMASGTNIGAAHPVVASGENIPDDMNQKVVNDLRAQMRSVVQLRDRNQAIAERMIEESLSLTAQEALEEGAIDVIASDVKSLLAAIDGRVVKLNASSTPGDGDLDWRIEIAANAKIITNEMSFSEQLIQFISSPEIAYMLLTGGMMAIFFEVITPGGFILGTLGGVMLLLGSIGLKMLPFSWAGVLLLGAGIVLMAVDIFAATSGLLTLIGLPVFCVGGLFLFRAPGGELLRFSISAVIGATVALALCFLLFVFLVVRGLKRRVATGSTGMIGLPVVAISGLTGHSDCTTDTSNTNQSFSELQTPNSELSFQVRCHGEIWRARLEPGATPLYPDDEGVVIAIDGITLVVRPVMNSATGDEGIK